MHVALAAGLASIAVAIAVSLSHAPLVAAGTNSIQPQAETGVIDSCQSDETLPAGTTAARLWMRADIGPSVRVVALAGSHVVTQGTHAAGWTGEVVTVPLSRVREEVAKARVCFALGPAAEAIVLEGGPSHHGVGISMRIEYLRPGPSSWWSLAHSVARRLGIARAPAGTWVFLIPLAAMTLAVLLVTLTILRQLGQGRDASPPPIAGAQAIDPPAPAHELRRGRDQPRGKRATDGRRRANARALFARVPGPAWACAAVACLSAASWSIVSPPFEITDEPSHFAYTQILAETGNLPNRTSDFSPLEATVVSDLDPEIRYDPTLGTISSVAQQQRLQHDLSQPLSHIGQGAAVAGSQPPLYYALETIPYKLASSGTLLDQLELMRLLSALMAGLTAIFAYLFLREALPKTPWAWTVGGLCTALAPLLGFISGAVNPEALLTTVSAALFYTLARAFRHGLTPATAAAIGATTAIGFLTKLNFIGLAPGILLALLLLTRRAARTSKHSAYRSLALALAIALSPICIYAAINLLSNHAGLGLASTGIADTNKHNGSILDELTYIWQTYLPRLPGMSVDFPAVSTIRQLWFDRLVGLYGWLDTHFPDWVYDFALVPTGLIAGLCVRELIRTRAKLRTRAGELASYAALALGLLVLIAASSYLEFPNRAGGYAEPRYLLPLAVLFAAVLTLATRGAGRRWGPAVGTLIVLLFLGYDIFSQLQVVARFYT